MSKEAENIKAYIASRRINRPAKQGDDLAEVVNAIVDEIASMRIDFDNTLQDILIDLQSLIEKTQKLQDRLDYGTKE